VLKLARMRAEAAKVAESKAISPYSTAELHGWFVERLALESKVQSNKWRLEELQKELNAITPK
jgi:hypothetical protein